MGKIIKHVMKAAIVLVALLAALAAIIVKKWKHEWRYEESGRRIANPDRGFYIQVSTDQGQNIAKAAESVRLVLLSFDMEGHTKGELPQEKLGELEEALEVAGREHVSVIFRAAYGYQDQVSEPERPEVADRHMEQIAEVLNRHKGLILVVQAGILGAYGEWHSSRYLEGTEDENRESRLRVLAQWERCLDPDIRLAVRRPRFVREAWEAGILEGRLGVHNDALLSTDSDMGTYDDPGMGRAQELAWTQEHLPGQVNGGEMPTPGGLNTPEHADREFAQLHMGYLNLKYNEEIIHRWEAQAMGGMDAKSYLENHLGYRLYLTDLAVRRLYLPWELAGKGARIRVGLRNTGYAALLGKYKAFVTVEAGGRQSCQEVEIPGLYQICNGQRLEADLPVKIPEAFLEGEDPIRIGLKIAPGGEEAEGQGCVELANDSLTYKEGVNWVASLGREGRFLFWVANQL